MQESRRCSANITERGGQSTETRLNWDELTHQRSVFLICCLRQRRIRMFVRPPRMDKGSTIKSKDPTYGQLLIKHPWSHNHKPNVLRRLRSFFRLIRHFLPPGRDEKGDVSPWWRLSRKKKKTIQTFFKNDKVCCRRARGSNGRFPGDLFLLTDWQQLIIVREKLVFPLFYKHHKRFLLLYQRTYCEYKMNSLCQTEWDNFYFLTVILFYFCIYRIRNI